MLFELTTTTLVYFCTFFTICGLGHSVQMYLFIVSGTPCLSNSVYVWMLCVTVKVLKSYVCSVIH